MKRYYLFFLIIAAVSALAIGSNSLLRRGPVHDAQVTQDLSTIQSAVDTYYLSKQVLPDNLTQVRLDADVSHRAGEYEYVRIDQTSYQLCATFQTVHSSRNSYRATSPTGTELPDTEDHSKGRQCFTYTEPLQNLPIKTLPLGQ